MAINIPATLVKIDRTLIAQKLYTPATFTETATTTSATYDPITGSYANSGSSTVHSFNVVLLDTDFNSLKGDEYNVTAKIMILPQNITFEPSTRDVYCIQGKSWYVDSIKLSPLDSLWEITVGRK
jgi:hypothetical protein